MVQAAFGTVIRQASEKNGELSQVSYEQKDPTTYERELVDALASGTGPDIFLLRQDYALKNAGKAAPIPFSALSKSQFENTFIEAATPFLSQSGIIGIPIFADPLILYWNKDMLASGGFAQPPKFWDELYNMSQKISTKNDAGSIVKATIAFGEYRNVNNAKDILVTLILQAGGYITVYDNTGRLTPALVPRGGGAAQASVSAARFYTEFADPSKNYYSWNRSLPDAQKEFAAGDLALYVGYASEEPLIARTNPNLNFAVSALPQIRSAKNVLSTARVYALAASRSGKNPAGAITVAFLLASNENAKALSTALGGSPARVDLLKASQPKSSPTMSLLPDDICKGWNVAPCSTTFAHPWLDPDPDKTAELFRAMIENTTSGSMLVGEAVQRADQELGHILGL